MERVIPPGQSARTMPLETWLRPTAMRSKKLYRRGQGVKRCRSQQTSHPRLDPRALWPRSHEFEQLYRLTPEMVEFLAGEFFPFTQPRVMTQMVKAIRYQSSKR